MNAILPPTLPSSGLIACGKEKDQVHDDKPFIMITKLCVEARGK
jgi:hypothetical protein